MADLMHADGMDDVSFVNGSDHLGGPETYRPDYPIRIALLVSSFTSIFVGLMVVISYCRLQSLRKHPSNLIMWRAVHDVGCCVTIVLAHYCHRHGIALRKHDCLISSFFLEFFSVAAESYTVVLAIDLMRSVRNPFINFRLSARMYHVGVISSAVLYATLLITLRMQGHVLYGRDNYLNICWIQREFDSGPNPFFWILFPIPVGGMYIISIYSVFFVRCRLWRGLPETFSARLDAFHRSKRTLIVYLTYWTLAACTYVFVLEAQHDHPKNGSDTFFALLLGGRCLATGLVWVLIHDVNRACDELHYGGRVRLNHSHETMQPALNSVLRKEIIYYTTYGLRHALRRAERHPHSFDRRRRRDAIRYNRIALVRQYEEPWDLSKRRNTRFRRQHRKSFRPSRPDRRRWGSHRAHGSSPLRQPLLTQLKPETEDDAQRGVRLMEDDRRYGEAKEETEGTEGTEEGDEKESLAGNGKQASAVTDIRFASSINGREGDEGAVRIAVDQEPAGLDGEPRDGKGASNHENGVIFPPEPPVESPPGPRTSAPIPIPGRDTSRHRGGQAHSPQAVYSYRNRWNLASSSLPNGRASLTAHRSSGPSGRQVSRLRPEQMPERRRASNSNANELSESQRPRQESESSLPGRRVYQYHHHRDDEEEEKEEEEAEEEEVDTGGPGGAPQDCAEEPPSPVLSRLRQGSMYSSRYGGGGSFRGRLRRERSGTASTEEDGGAVMDDIPLEGRTFVVGSAPSESSFAPVSPRQAAEFGEQIMQADERRWAEHEPSLISLRSHGSVGESAASSATGADASDAEGSQTRERFSSQTRERFSSRPSGTSGSVVSPGASHPISPGHNTPLSKDAAAMLESLGAGTALGAGRLGETGAAGKGVSQRRSRQPSRERFWSADWDRMPGDHLPSLAGVGGPGVERSRWRALEDADEEKMSDGDAAKLPSNDPSRASMNPTSLPVRKPSQVSQSGLAMGHVPAPAPASVRGSARLSHRLNDGGSDAESAFLAGMSQHSRSTHRHHRHRRHHSHRHGRQRRRRREREPPLASWREEFVETVPMAEFLVPFFCCRHCDDSEEAFTFMDYEPHIFRRIRELSNISSEEYLRALSTTKREKFSEGSSGAFLYFSVDERFIVKTMERGECDVLLGMVSDLCNYLEDHPSSLITRFYGCHAIRMYGQMLYFVVMENVLATHGASVHERYDLKGSWVNRHLQPPERGKRSDCRYCGETFVVGEADANIMCPARPNRTHVPNTVMKDSDLTYKLRLERATALQLGDQIAADANFLRQHGIMDYSLLLGIHREKYRLVYGPEGEEDDHDHDDPRLGGTSPAYSRGLDAQQNDRAVLPPIRAPQQHDNDDQEGGNVERPVENGVIPSDNNKKKRALRPIAMAAEPSPSVGGADTPTGFWGFSLPHPSDEGEEGAVLPESSDGDGSGGVSRSDSGGGVARKGTGGRVDVTVGLVHNTSPLPVSYEPPRVAAAAPPPRRPGGVPRQEQGRRPAQAAPRAVAHRLLQRHGGDVNDSDADDSPNSVVSESPLVVDETAKVPRPVAPPEGGVGAGPAAVSVPYAAARRRQAKRLRAESGTSLGRQAQRATRQPTRARASSGDELVVRLDERSRRRIQAAMSSTQQLGERGGAAATGSSPGRRSRGGKAALESHVRRYWGGVRATVVEGPAVYYMGIIDVLQQYTWRKKLERFFKSVILLQPADGVSATPPDEYARRFRDRVIHQIIDDYVPPAENVFEEDQDGGEASQVSLPSPMSTRTQTVRAVGRPRGYR